MDVSIRRQAESDRDPTHHLILVLHQELDTLDGGGGGLGDGLEDTDTVEQHVWTCHDPLRTADTPPIMKSTAHGRQVSIHIL